MGDCDDRHTKRPLARVHVMPSGVRPENAGLAPSLDVRRGRVVGMDGLREADFDATDEFIARHGLVLEIATEAMRLDALTFARMLVHPSVPPDQLLRLGAGMTPGMLTASVGRLRPPELRMAAVKLETLPRGRTGMREVVAVDTGSPWSTALLASWHAGHGVSVRVAHRAGDADDRSDAALFAAARRGLVLRAAGVRGTAGSRPAEHAPETLIGMLVDLETGLAGLAATFGGTGADHGPHALRRQAVAAGSLGWVHLARTLERAAELTAYDESEIRRICDLVDGAGASIDPLRHEATALAARGAQACADLVRGAVEYYGRSASSG